MSENIKRTDALKKILETAMVNGIIKTEFNYNI